MTKKAVIIGGGGFVGQRLVALLAGDVEGTRPDWPTFDRVHVLDATPFEEPAATRAARARSGLELTSAVGDVCSKEDVREAVRGAHTVFHLASIVYVGLAHEPKIQRVNVDGVRNVVRACVEEGVRCLVYTATEDVVLSERPVIFGDESLPYPERPIHDYVRTKVEGEKAALAADGEGAL